MEYYVFIRKGSRAKRRCTTRTEIKRLTKDRKSMGVRQETQQQMVHKGRTKIKDIAAIYLFIILANKFYLLLFSLFSQ